MKKKILLTMTSALLAATLVGCGGGNSSSSQSSPAEESSSKVSSKESLPVSSETPISSEPISEEPIISESISEEPIISESESEEPVSSEEEAPAYWLERFLEGLGDYNFTATYGDDLVGDWATIYGLGPNAIYIDYADAAVSYGATDFGYIVYDGSLYDFSLNDGEFKLGDYSYIDLMEGETLYDHFYEPTDLFYAEFDDDGDGVYTTDDAGLKLSIANASGRNGTYVPYFSEITMNIADDYDSACITVLDSHEGDPFTIVMKIFDVGSTSIEAIDAFLENPVVNLPDWPSSDIDALLQVLFPETEATLPELPGKAYVVTNVELAEYFGNGNVVVYGVGDKSEEYGKILLDNGWTLRSNGNYLSPTGDVEVKLTYYKIDNLFYIYIQKPTILEWPAEGVASMIQSIQPGSRTEIPAFEGADFYVIYDDEEIDAYTDDDTLGEDYEEALINSGWTLDNYGYISPDEDILLYIEYVSYYGCYEIYFYAYPLVF